MATADPIRPDIERRRADPARRSNQPPVGNFVDSRIINQINSRSRPDDDPPRPKTRRTVSTYKTRFQIQAEELERQQLARESAEQKEQKRRDEAVRSLLGNEIARVDRERLPEPPYETDPEFEDTNEEEQSGEPGAQRQGLASQAGDQFKQAAANRLKKEAQKRGVQALEKGLGLLGPYGKAAALAIEAVKRRKQILIAIGVIVLILGLIVVGVFALIVYATSTDPQLQGSSAVQPVSAADTTQQSQIQKLLGSTTISTADAQTLKTEIEALSGRAGTNVDALAALNAMRTAVQTIIDNNGKDATVTSSQLAIIKKNYNDFFALSSSSPNCNGAPTCLNVPPVGQSMARRCQQAATLGVIMYYTGPNSAFAQQNVLRDSEGNFYDKPTGTECFFDLTALNREAGSVGKGEWIRFNYKAYGLSEQAGKTKLFDAIINSLQHGDPVIVYFKQGGIQRPRHIVPIVGYNANEEPSQGGTFYVHHPFELQPSGKRYYAFINQIRGTKFTKNHFIQHVGGDGIDGWSSSAVIRKIYTQ